MTDVATGVLVASLLNGLRHGFDIDHLAAIADITGAGTSRRRGLIAATTYAFGHASVVLVLGVASVLLGAQLPGGIDSVMQRIVGATLVLLGLYVLYSIARFRRGMRLHSRWTLVGAGLKWLWRRAQRVRPVVIEHEHEHRHDVVHAHTPAELAQADPEPEPDAPDVHSHPHAHVGIQGQDPARGTGLVAAMVVGMLHGVGAETPTQLLLFGTAAGAASDVVGLAVVIAFIAGLLVSNTLVALATSFGFAGGRRLPLLYLGLALLTALFSLAVGGRYLLG